MKDIDNDTLLEEDLRPLLNLTITPPIPSRDRLKYSILTWNVDEKEGRIRKVVGTTYSISEEGIVSSTPIARDIRSVEDVFEVVIEGGTCFIPCSGGFLSLIDDLLPYEPKVDLSRGEKSEYRGYSIEISTKGGRVLRRGAEWGRIFSFWDCFPAWVIDQLDEFEPDPITLKDFESIFLLVLSRATEEGISLATVHSTGSLAANWMLSTNARVLFGRLDEIPLSVLEDAHQAYKGSIFDSAKNVYDSYNHWDLIAAYPYEISRLVPCQNSHMGWRQVTDIAKEKVRDILLNQAAYAFLLCHVVPTKTYKYSPVLLRYITPFGPRLAGFLAPQVVRLTLPEYKMLVLRGYADVGVLDGSIGTPRGEPFFAASGPMHKGFRLKEDKVLGRMVSGMLHASAGKMGQINRERTIGLTEDLKGLQEIWRDTTSPIFGLIYAAHINGAVRAKVMDMALRYDAAYIRADGFASKLGSLSVAEEGEEMGKVRLKSSGKSINPDDMLLGGPGDTYLLDTIISSEPGSAQYTLWRKGVTTLKGEIYRQRGKRLRAGQVRLMSDTRTFGSKKRIPTSVRRRENILGDGITGRPGESRLELAYIRSYGGGYGYS